MDRSKEIVELELRLARLKIEQEKYENRPDEEKLADILHDRFCPVKDRTEECGYLRARVGWNQSTRAII